MFIAYSDLVRFFPKSQGIRDEIQFYTVSTDASLLQPKGLFIPLFNDSGELKEAIQNGAIGAVWDEKRPLPSYVPTQFPILFSNNVKDSLKTIIESYLEQINGDNIDIMNMTKYLFIEEKLLKESVSSYDKPVFEIVSKPERRG
ncbi:MAG TPA: hypothetical protein VEV44_11950 [Pseudoneobacillus sp.]|nr:hypothetical protein [Pseudoneobacillus sp.]